MDVSDCLCIYMCVCLCPSVLVSARQLTCENVCVYVCVSFMNAPRFVSVEVFLFVSIRLNSLGIFDYSRFEQWIQILQATFPIVQWIYCICVFFRQQQQSAATSFLISLPYIPQTWDVVGSTPFQLSFALTFSRVIF